MKPTILLIYVQVTLCLMSCSESERVDTTVNGNQNDKKTIIYDLDKVSFFSSGLDNSEFRSRYSSSMASDLTVSVDDTIVYITIDTNNTVTGDKYTYYAGDAGLDTSAVAIVIPPGNDKYWKVYFNPNIDPELVTNGGSIPVDCCCFAGPGTCIPHMRFDPIGYYCDFAANDPCNDCRDESSSNSSNGGGYIIIMAQDLYINGTLFR